MTYAGLLILVFGFFLMIIVGIPEVTRRTRGMFYGWIMAGLGTLLIALGIMPLYGGLAIWNPVLRNTFGWSAGQMAWGFSMTMVQEGSLSPVVGLLVDKLGSRRMVCIGLVILGSGFVLFSQIRELWQLYVVFFIMSLGSSLCSYLPMMTVMNNWFVRYRARAMALVMEGLALGGIIVPFLLAWSIGGSDPDISERYGWRNTALFIGVLCLALAVPLSSLVRNRPEDMGLKPDGVPALPATTSRPNTGLSSSDIEDGGFTWREAIRSKPFWLITLSHAATGTALGTIAAHLGLLLDDRGFSLHTISAVVGVYTLTQGLVIPLAGYLGDKFSLRHLASGFSAVFPIAVVVLILAQNTGMLFLFAVLWGVSWGGRNSVMAPLRGAYFGRRAFATITGMSMVPSSISMVIAAVIAGFMRDATGTYDVSFLAIAVISAFGSILLSLLGEPLSRASRGSITSQAAD